MMGSAVIVQHWRWCDAAGRKHFPLIHSEAVNLFPPKERHKHNTTQHNKTPPTQSREPLPRSREWILSCCLISPHCSPAFPTLPPPSVPEGQRVWWLTAWKPARGKQSTHHQTTLIALMSRLPDRRPGERNEGATHTLSLWGHVWGWQ